MKRKGKEGTRKSTIHKNRNNRKPNSNTFKKPNKNSIFKNYNQGIILSESKSYTPALEKFSHVLNLSPKMSEAIYNKSVSLPP